MATESRKDKLAEWIRGWRIPPNTPDDHTHDAHNDAINMVIDQLYDPEESGEVDALLDDGLRISGKPAQSSEARRGVGNPVESEAVDKSGVEMGKVKSLADEITTAGWTKMKESGSAETGGEKAAPQNDEHLPNLSDHCDECGHVRAKHEYGAIGYNAASNCTLDDCDCPWWLEPNFPRSSQNQTIASGVEGVHEGTTADKSEPEKLNNAQKADELIDDLRLLLAGDFLTVKDRASARTVITKWLAESSLSSPPPLCRDLFEKYKESYSCDLPLGHAGQHREQHTHGAVHWDSEPTVRQSSSLSESGPESAHSGKQNTADKSELLPTQLPKEK